MSLLTLGINHQTAPVAVRERIVFSAQELASALRAMHQLPEVAEVAILSTCNRTELYCDLRADAHQPIIDWLAAYHQLEASELKSYLYEHPPHATVRHMLRVASGLDSMILGEPQILGQLKDAYRAAAQAGTLGSLLGRLFEHTFAVAKKIRTSTAIGASPVSVAFAAVRLSQQIFGELRKHTALLIGAGETIELAARHLHEQGIGGLIVANRTVERARDLAQPFGGYAISLAETARHLAEADIVIASTASPTPVVQHAEVVAALQARKHRPIFMVDIAVPRDIDPAVSELEDVYLYTVDDLHDVIEENLKSRRQAAQQAEEIISVQVEHFLAWMQSLDAVQSIRALREQAELTRGEVLAKAERQLAQGKPAAEVLQYLAQTLTNKLMHAPSANLKQAAYEGHQDLIKAAQRLFDLPPSEHNQDPN